MSVYRTDDRQYALMASSAHTASVLPHAQKHMTFKRRNVSQLCTITVALFVDLPVDWVLDAPRGPYLDTGVSTWGAIEEAGHWVICKCLLHRYEPAPLGSRLGGWLPCRTSLVSGPALFWIYISVSFEIHANDFLATSKLLLSLGFSFLPRFRTSIGRFRPRSRRNWKLNDYICHQDLCCRVITMDEYHN